MTNLSDYADDALLTTREVAVWLGITVKVVRRLPIMPVPLPTRERRYLAGDVKALIAAKAQRRLLPMRRSA